MKRPEKNRLEWTVFGLSLLLVLGTLAYLTREALTTEELPPRVEVRLGEPEAGPGGFTVPVTVYNSGGTAAEDVRITVLLATRDGASEEGRLVIPFLPRESDREGWVTFRTDPRRGTLRVGGVAFQAP